MLLSSFVKLQIIAWFILIASHGSVFGTPDDPRVVVANADGLIDVAAASQIEKVESIPNPFRMKIHPSFATRDMPLVVSAVLLGEQSAAASVVINGNVYSPGETLEKFTIAAIGADTVDLRLDQLIARVPVQNQQVRVRLPR